MDGAGYGNQVGREVERGGDLRVGADAVEAIQLLQGAGLAELGHAEVDAAHPPHGREERERVRVAVQGGDHRGRAVGGEELVEDRGVAGTGP